MKLPYNRPWLLELADHPSCPPTIREGVQNMLTFMWTHRVPPFQSKAPYLAASDVLERVLRDVEEDLARAEAGAEAEAEADEKLSEASSSTSESTVVAGARAGAGAGGMRKEEDRLTVVDFCSGAGGPVGHVERRINRQRKAEHLPPTPFLLSDLHPPLATWQKHYGTRSAYSPTNRSTGAPSTSLSYIPQPVDATHAPLFLGRKRHLRTFFLSFHHFNEELARGVLVDAMRGAEGIAIYELQSADIGSLIMIAMLLPLTWILTPFTRPSRGTLFFTYVIPLIPLILVIDGWTSVYRTRPVSHVLHLANLASLSLQLEGEDKGLERDWKWEYGRERHTWPFGYMTWIVGRKRPSGGDEGDETDADDLL
ncbi:hypothetical protein IAU60_000892 [Kwoniella sp. DSM 27419]